MMTFRSKEIHIEPGFFNRLRLFVINMFEPALLSVGIIFALRF